MTCSVALTRLSGAESEVHHRLTLSGDQRDVYTDYPIVSAVILYQKTLEQSQVPGRLPAVVVSVRGGTTTIRGVPFTARYRGQPEMNPGAEALLLLSREGEKYRIVGDYYGVFHVSADRITPGFESPTFAQEIRGLTSEIAVDRIVARVRQLHTPGT
jgi:hypothetical protein